MHMERKNIELDQADAAAGPVGGRGSAGHRDCGTAGCRGPGASRNVSRGSRTARDREDLFRLAMRDFPYSKRPADCSASVRNARRYADKPRLTQRNVQWEKETSSDEKTGSTTIFPGSPKTRARAPPLGRRHRADFCGFPRCRKGSCASLREPRPVREADAVDATPITYTPKGLIDICQNETGIERISRLRRASLPHGLFAVQNVGLRCHAVQFSRCACASRHVVGSPKEIRRN